MGKKRYIYLACGAELDRLAGDAVAGGKGETRACCPGCGSEAIGLAKECPLCGELMPDHYIMCDFCEANVRAGIMALIPSDRREGAALVAIAEMARRMANGGQKKGGRR